LPAQESIHGNGRARKGRIMLAASFLGAGVGFAPSPPRRKTARPKKSGF
jgi:hypothetical protein